MRIFHLATVSDWTQAQATGSYTTSTRGVSLEQEGYIHASREDQWRGVHERYYADADEPLVLLEIDTDLLDARGRRGAAGAGATETFPHVYGPITPLAVVSARDVAALLAQD